MQAAGEMKPAVETQAQPASTGEASSCAAPAGRTSQRRWLIGAAALGVPLVLYGGWDWLAATGASAILIGIVPCLLMCAFGLCMGRGKKNAELSLTDIRKTYETTSGEPPSRG